MPEDPSNLPSPGQTIPLGGSPPAGGAPPAIDGSQIVRFKANKADREMTLEDALGYASKGFAAEEKFRTAAEMVKEAEEKLASAEQAQRWKDDVEAVRQGDMDAFRRLAPDWGFSEEATEQVIAQHIAQQYGTPEQPSPEGPAFADPRHLTVLHKMEKMLTAFEKADIDPVKALAQARDFQGAEAQQKLKTVVFQALERDPIFGRLVKDPQKSQAIREDAWNRVAGKFSAKKDVVEAIQESFSEMKALFGAYDKLAGPAQPGGVYPGSLGTIPTSDAGFSRLQPPKEPKIDDFRDDLPGYMKKRLEYEEWRRQNSE